MEFPTVESAPAVFEKDDFVFRIPPCKQNPVFFLLARTFFCLYYKIMCSSSLSGNEQGKYIPANQIAEESAKYLANDLWVKPDNDEWRMIPNTKIFIVSLELKP